MAKAARQAQSATRYKVVFEHDDEPDFSWLTQDHYNPQHPSYQPTYRTRADMVAGRNPIDGEWYRNPENHVALYMVAYALGTEDEDWQVVDSLGSIDFLVDDDDWATGTFYTLQALDKYPYLQELAKDAGLR